MCIRDRSEWTYEFLINVFDANGILKANRVAKGNYYIPNREGKRLLCFALDLGAGLSNFWEEGKYRVEVLCFDQPVIQLEFSIGEQDLPYNFTDEIAGINGQVHEVAGEPSTPQDKEAVSYTHLDVYKRQECNYDSRGRVDTL